jgi:hypothetical protein
MFPGVWGQIRTRLIKTCGEGIDRNWFSKLTANVDEERRGDQAASSDFVLSGTGYSRTISICLSSSAIKKITA